MLRGYRMIADASEAMLINEDVLKGADGFYQKIEIDEDTNDDKDMSVNEQHKVKDE